VPGPYRAEVAPVQGDNDLGVEPLGQSDNGRISATERKIRIVLDQLGNTSPLIRARRLDLELAHTSEEAGLRGWASLRFDKIDRLRNDHGGDYETQVRALKHVDAPLMMAIGRVGDRNQWP
jgi:hypothetical protein